MLGSVLKLVPVIVTVVPATPEAAVNSAIVGFAPTKSVDEVAMPPFASTVIFSVVAFWGMVTVKEVVDASVTVASVPLNFTILSAAKASKPIPVIFTVVPTIPEVGVKLVIEI